MLRAFFKAFLRYEEYDFEHVSLEKGYNFVQGGDFKRKGRVVILCRSGICLLYTSDAADDRYKE